MNVAALPLYEEILLATLVKNWFMALITSAHRTGARRAPHSTPK
jgi:hypothetical protein